MSLEPEVFFNNCDLTFPQKHFSAFRNAFRTLSELEYTVFRTDARFTGWLRMDSVKRCSHGRRFWTHDWHTHHATCKYDTRFKALPSTPTFMGSRTTQNLHQRSPLRSNGRLDVRSQPRNNHILHAGLSLDEARIPLSHAALTNVGHGSRNAQLHAFRRTKMGV